MTLFVAIELSSSIKQGNFLVCPISNIRGELDALPANRSYGEPTSESQENDSLLNLHSQFEFKQRDNLNDRGLDYVDSKINEMQESPFSRNGEPIAVLVPR